jgi:hypothetical protein
MNIPSVLEESCVLRVGVVTGDGLFSCVDFSARTQVNPLIEAVVWLAQISALPKPGYDKRHKWILLKQ